MKNKNLSLISVFLFFIFIGSLIFLLHPKFNKSGQAATISWDVCGYYYYLPAIFIYKDIKKLNFKDSISNKYKPTPQFDQAFKTKNGNYVFKYSCGQAIQYLPAFLVGHLITKYFTNYPADGFSKPYQLSIAFGCFLITLLGLWYMRKILLIYFNDSTTAITLATLVLVTNYLNYTAFDGAMTHNTVFTLYTLIIYFTIQFYNKPTYIKSALIGGLIGLATLTRPTEIISVLIPVLWGVNILSRQSLLLRWNLIIHHFSKFALAIMACIAVGSIQIIYWKYVSGHWIVYSYQDQGFSWLRPHIINGLFSYKCGWLMYTPVMFFALIGIYLMRKIDSTKTLVSIILVFTLLFIYVAFAWDIWWYGGSLGQRTMVQAYAMLCIPLGSFFEYVSRKKWLKLIITFFWFIFLYLNLWWTYNAHIGKFFYVELINRAYFLHVLGRWDFDENDLKILDTNELNINEFKKAEILYTNDFEKDTSATTFGEKPIDGNRSFCVDKNVQFTPEFCFNSHSPLYEVIRTSATFKCSWREWDFWKFAQFIIRYKDHSKVVKEKIVRLDRFYTNGETKEFHFDIKIPNKSFDQVCIQLWNGGGNNRFLMDDLKVEGLITK